MRVLKIWTSLNPLTVRVSTTKTKEPSPITTTTASKPTSTKTQQPSQTQTVVANTSTTKPPVIVPTRNTSNRIDQLVDKGCGSEHYELLEIVGKGSEGRVYKARPLSTQAKEMVKILSKNHIPGDVDEKQVAQATYSSEWVAVKVIEIKSDKKLWIARELKIMRQLGKHPHLVSFISAHLHKKNNTVWIAMGWIEGRSLRHIVDEHSEAARRKNKCTPVFDEDKTRKLAVSMFSALATLHSYGSTHGDIDVSNIMRVMECQYL